MKPTRETKSLVSKYIQAEKELMGHLEELEHGSDYCQCDEPEHGIEVIDAGTMLVVKYCLVCGGAQTP